MRCLSCTTDGIPVWTVSCPLCRAHLKTQRANALAPKTALQRGRYVVDQPIRRTDYDITYRAYQTKPERIVVLKEFYARHLSYRRTPGGVVGYGDGQEEMHGQGVARFLLEAERMQAVKHPNIAAVYGCFEELGTAYQVREYLPGRTLYGEMTTEEPEPEMPREWFLRALPEGRVRHVVGALALGLSAAHAKKIYHLDIQPRNVLVQHDDRVVLTDFDVLRRGLFWQLPETPPLSPYAAPEVGGGARVGPASDIFALGMLLHELLTAQLPPRPHPRNGPFAAGPDETQHPNWSPDAAPAPFRARIARALAPSPSDRPADVLAWWSG